MVQRGTNPWSKRGSELEADSDSNDSPMVQTGTINHINQMNGTRSIDETAARPSSQNGDAQPVPDEPSKAPMRKILKEFCRKGRRAFRNEEEV